MKIHRHSYKAWQIEDRTAEHPRHWDRTHVVGYRVYLQCSCGRKKKELKGNFDSGMYSWEKADTWDKKLTPTVAEYNKIHNARNRDITVSKALIAILATLGVIGFFVAGFIGSIFSFRADAVRMEETIIAQYDQNRNNYDNMWKRFQEVASVPEMYTEDMKEVFDSAMTGRYGADGSQAMFQWIKEHNPQFDSSLYTKIQTVVEAGRLSFETDQKQLIDKKREYQTLLRSNRALWVNWILHFPKIDLDKYDIVTSAETEEAFETKEAGKIELR